MIQMNTAGSIVPTLSRRTVAPQMAARGMRSAAELAEGKPCGTRIRYYAGCRCVDCRKANSLYETDRAEAKKRGEGNHVVSAERARAHLAWLSQQGVGRKTVADAAKVAASSISKVIDGERLKIRAQTERRILAVTPAAAMDGARIHAAPTWLLLDELIAQRYSKSRIASEILGHPARALQISRRLVEVRTAGLVQRVHERLVYAAPADQRAAQKLVQELREEGYRPDVILCEMAALAALRGWPEPTLGRGPRGKPAPMLRRQEVALLKAVHARLTEEPV